MSGEGDQTPESTQQERQLAVVGARSWNDYVDRFAGPGGVNEKFIQYTRATEGDKESAAGQVGADAAMATKGFAAGAPGMAAGSGKALAAEFNPTMALAATTGRAKAAAVQGVEDAQLAADMKLASFGRGLSYDANTGLTQSTARATELVNADAKTKFAERQAMMEAAGEGLGMYGYEKGWFKGKPGGKKGGRRGISTAVDYTPYGFGKK